MITKEDRPKIRVSMERYAIVDTKLAFLIADNILVKL